MRQYFIESILKWFVIDLSRLRGFQLSSRRTIETCLFVFCITSAMGCETFDMFANTKVENPVMPDAPMRVTGLASQNSDDPSEVAGSGMPELRTASNGVTTVNFEDRDHVLKNLTAETVVATVNGAPVFAGEILDPYKKMFDEAKDKAPPAEFQKAQEAVLRRDLQHHIERKLLVDKMRAGLKKEQLEMLTGFMDKAFGDYVAGRMKEANLKSEQEFEQKLIAETGNSLAHLKTVFQNSTMAREYLTNQAKVNKTVGRPELLAYYRDHKEDYAMPARVRWRRIAISFAKNDGKRGAFAVAEEAIDALKGGTDFSDVAQEFSDGPKARNGGNWGWTEKGSLKDQAVEAELFQLPLNVFSGLMTGDGEFVIVQVLDREETHHRSFTKVQEAIKEKLENELEEQAKKKVLDDLVEEALIVTIFDKSESRRPTQEKSGEG